MLFMMLDGVSNALPNGRSCSQLLAPESSDHPELIFNGWIQSL